MSNENEKIGKAIERAAREECQIRFCVALIFSAIAQSFLGGDLVDYVGSGITTLLCVAISYPLERFVKWMLKVSV